MDFSKLDPTVLEDLGEDELEKLADQIFEALGEEGAQAVVKASRTANLIERSRVFSLDGFRAFFEFMNGFTLHREGEIWAENIFIAIAGLRKLLQEAFRGSGKTTVISKYFVAFYIGHHPETTNMIVRVNTQKARETALEVATMIESDNRWKVVFPDVVPDKKRGWGAETGYYLKRYVLNKDGEEDYSAWLQMCSDTGRPSGATFIGYGYDSGSNQGSRTNGVLLIDDIHDKNNTASDKQLADVKNYVKEILLPIPVPGQGIEIWNFTPWLSNDAYAERKETGMYIHSRSPVMTQVNKSEAVDEAGEIKDGYIYWSAEWQLPEDNEKGEDFPYPFTGKYWVLGWPERWTQEEIARIFKDILAVAFARMYMLDLKATEGLELRAEWLHVFPHEKIDPSWMLVAGIDYASVVDRLKHRDRDYFAMAIGALIPGGGLVLLDGVRRQVTLGEALQVTYQKLAEYPGRMSAIGVEAIGKGEEFYGQVRFANDIFGKPLPIYPITHHSQSKGVRFEQYLGPRFQFSRIWITNIENEFIKFFKNEWLTYPNGEHDDCLDAVYMMAQMADPHLAINPQTGPYKKKDEKPKIHPIAQAFGRR